LVSKFFPMFFKFLCFALYNLYSFLGLGHISLRFFLVRVCIVKVVIGLMAKYQMMEATNTIKLKKTFTIFLSTFNLMYVTS
jgi:hypothetical protein